MTSEHGGPRTDDGQREEGIRSRQFIVPHINEIPEISKSVDLAISLANILMNTGFLGCKY